MINVSVIIPCKNEEKYIGKMLEGLLQQDFPKENWELIFVDGKSNDKTISILSDYAKQYSFIKILENKAGFVPQAMNMGIQQSLGEIIVRLDAHAFYPIDYVSKLVFALNNFQADNVGGIWKTEPLHKNNKSLAIANALANPFGVGNSHFRLGIDKPMEVDTVPFGCYKKSVFEKIGWYDERLQRNQDIELNKRLKKAGGKIILLPDVYSVYYSRETFGKLFQNNFENGKWVILTTYFTNELKSLSIRHFIPLCFVAYALISIPISLKFAWVLLPLLLHFLMNLFFSFKIAVQQKSVFQFPFLVIAFYTLHISYGFGSIAGIFSVLQKMISKK